MILIHTFSIFLIFHAVRVQNAEVMNEIILISVVVGYCTFTTMPPYRVENGKCRETGERED